MLIKADQLTEKKVQQDHLPLHVDARPDSFNYNKCFIGNGGLSKEIEDFAVADLFKDDNDVFAGMFLLSSSFSDL